MKFSISWLKTHLDTSASLDTITNTLTNLGLEVEDVTNPGEYLKNFTIAQIVDAQPHPDADRLQICTVDIGTERPLQIVCGAPNARANLKVAFAKVGIHVTPINVILKKSIIRGVESQGMLCSEFELGLATESNGILELSQDAPIGQNLADHLAMDDPVITIKITPNRGDCLGVRGIARDLAAAGLGTLKPFEPYTHQDAAKGKLQITSEFSNQENDACPHFIGRFISGVKNGPSPQWLQQRLKSIGLNPISALVDITNFISYDLGRPLHVFDGDKIENTALILRMSRQGEAFTSLKDIEYTLQDGMTVVADAKGLLALAGVMGGLSSGCSTETTNIILEAAYFDPIRTAKTGRTLDIRSDARYRFERGVDPESTKLGLEHATKLILDFCGGQVIETVEVGTPPHISLTISYNPDLIAKVGGITINNQIQKTILTALGCTVNDANSEWLVNTPPWRHDLKISMDLVEEILRIHGYDAVPAHVPDAYFQRKVVKPLLARSHQARYVLAHRGLQETITYSMINKAMMEYFGGAHENLRIANPISLELEYLRPSILPHLINAARENGDKGMANINIFEIGPQYHGSIPGDQHTVAAIMRTGTVQPNHWAQQNRSFDIYDVKGDVLAVLQTFGVQENQMQVSTDHLPSWYHPGRSGVIQQGPKSRLAVFGELHPLIAKSLGIKGKIVMAEIFLDNLPFKQNGDQKPALHLSPYQPVERDFSFIVDRHLTAYTLIQNVKKTHRQLITKAEIFDIFQHDSLGNDKKALGIRVRLEPHERTLTEEDIQKISQDIIHAVEKLGGILR